jgi:hypothetical protein
MRAGGAAGLAMAGGFLLLEIRGNPMFFVKGKDDFSVDRVEKPDLISASLGKR